MKINILKITIQSKPFTLVNLLSTNTDIKLTHLISYIIILSYIIITSTEAVPTEGTLSFPVSYSKEKSSKFSL